MMTINNKKAKLSAQKPQFEVAQIFQEYGPPYREKHPLSDQEREVMRLIEICRTSVLGGHIEKCNSCQEERQSYNSCCNRHCPKCQSLAKEKWLLERMTELLPGRYFHNVFTLPHNLNLIALYNKDLFYDLLFKAASRTMLQFGRDPKHLGGKIGFLAVLHTWDQKMLDHFHLHLIIPGGALSFDNDTWIPSKRKNFLFPVKALSAVFRGKFIDYLEKAYENGEIFFPEKIKGFKSKSRFNALISKLYKNKWVVYSKRPFKGPEKVMDYLGRYTHRVAISNHRILSIKDGEVTFKYRDRKDNNKEKPITIKAEEFIRRFLLHVLPPSFMKIRHFGFLANKNKKDSLERCRQILGVPDIVLSAKKTLTKDPLEMLKIRSGIDIKQCPFCKKGTMVIVKEIIGQNSHWKKIKNAIFCGSP